jgi:hypothetical protein
MSFKSHSIAGTLHVIQAVAVTLLLIKEDAVEYDLRSDSFGKSETIATYNLAVLLPFFSFLSAANHISSALQPQYANAAQWSEYALSAGIMNWLIANLSGVVDLRTLISITILNVLLQSVGYQLNEQGVSHSQKTRLLWIGFGLHTAIWVHLFLSFYHAIGSATQEVPNIVYGIIWVMFALNTTFGVWAGVSNGRDPEQNQITNGYILLSFITKSLLTWMVYFGIIRGRQNEEIQEL